MWITVSLATSGKSSIARDALIIVDVPGDPDQRPSEKTGAPQTWHYVNAVSLPVSALTNQLKAISGTLVSIQTVRTRIRANNLRPRRPAVRPPLLQWHRAVSETGEHVMLGGNILSVFDESRFTLQFNDERELCIDVQERDLLTSTSVSACRLLTVESWFGVDFRSMTRTPLNVIDGKLPGNCYL